MLPSMRVGLKLLGRSSCSSSSSSLSVRFASSLYDHRRVANRKGWKGPEDPDPDFWVLPDERLGNSYDLNWALTNMSIAPKGDAYLNLFPRGLQNLSSSPLTPEKATVVEQEEQEMPVFLNSHLDSAEQYRQSLRELRMYFSELPNIFVNDGAVGSSNHLGQKVRVVSDNADTSLFLSHNLIQLPASDPYGFNHTLTVYCAQGLGETPSATVDMEKGEVQLRGPTTNDQLQDVLANLFLAKGEGDFDLVKCDARVEEGGEVSLVLDGAGKGSGFGSSPSQLYGAKHVVVSEEGLSRLWKGISTASSLVTPSRGNIVSKNVKTMSLEGKGNTTSLPSKLFFLVEGMKKKVDKVDKGLVNKLLQDQKILLAGSGERFYKLLDSAEIYMVNVGGVSEEEVNGIMTNPEAHLSQPKSTKAKKSKK